MFDNRHFLLRSCLAGIVLFTVMVGPGCTKSPKLQVAVRVLYVQIWADSLNRTLEDECQKWALRNDTRVVFEPVALADIDARVAAIMEAGRGADVLLVPSHYTALYRSRLLPLTDVVSGVRAAGRTFYDVATAMNAVDGTWYGVPLYAWSHLLVVRRDWLMAARDSLPGTFAELARVARELTRKEVGVYGLGLGLGKDDDFAMFFQSLLWAYGGRVFGSDGKSVELDSRETRAALQYVVDRYRDGVFPPGAFGWDGASNNRAFLAGSIALTFNSPTIYYVAKRQQPEIAREIIHGVYPGGPAGRFSYATGFSLVVPRSSREGARAKSLIRFLTDRKQYQALIEAADGSVDPMMAGFEDLPLWRDPVLRPALESVRIMRPLGWPGPVTRAAAEVFQRRILSDMVSRVINDHMTIDVAVLEATARVKDVLATTHD